MAKAGYCSECGANQWLAEDGSCTYGHAADRVSGVYDAPKPSASTEGGMPNAWSKVPLPLKVLLGVLFLPFTILYGIYVMWKQGRFSTAARVALTAVGALLAFAMLSPAFGGSGPPPSDQPATPASTNVAPVSSAESTSTATVSSQRLSQQLSRSRRLRRLRLRLLWFPTLPIPSRLRLPSTERRRVRSTTLTAADT
jgi:hypothetical protein